MFFARQSIRSAASCTRTVGSTHVPNAGSARSVFRRLLSAEAAAKKPMGYVSSSSVSSASGDTGTTVAAATDKAEEQELSGAELMAAKRAMFAAGGEGIVPDLDTEDIILTSNCAKVISLHDTRVLPREEHCFPPHVHPPPHPRAPLKSVSRFVRIIRAGENRWLFCVGCVRMSV